MPVGRLLKPGGKLAVNIAPGKSPALVLINPGARAINMHGILIASPGVIFKHPIVMGFGEQNNSSGTCHGLRQVFLVGKQVAARGQPPFISNPLLIPH